MAETLRPDLCILGDSAAGLHAALLAAAFGVPVILVTGRPAGLPPNRDRTLALYRLRAAAMRATLIRTATDYGLEALLTPPDAARILQPIRAAEEAVAPRHAFARFRALGVRIIEDEARFENATTLRAGNDLIKARRYIIADAPSVPAMLPSAIATIDGLTIDHFFDADKLPSSIAIVGHDEACVGLAQSLARLNVTTHLIAEGALLPGEDREATAIITTALQRDGVAVHEHANVTSAHPHSDGTIRLTADTAGATVFIDVQTLLNPTAGRRDLEGLGLAAAGIGSTSAGIRVDQRLRTDHHAVFAIGAVAALPFNLSAHAGQAQAECVMKQILFRLPMTFDPLAMARVVPTDPEMAAVGLTETQARERHGAIAVLRGPFSSNDRARADGQPAGHSKMILDRRGRLLGGSIVGEHASSLIAPWSASLGRKPDALRAARAPSLSLAETPGRALAESYAPLARSRLVRGLSAFLRRWG